MTSATQVGGYCWKSLSGFTCLLRGIYNWTLAWSEWSRFSPPRPRSSHFFSSERIKLHTKLPWKYVYRGKKSWKDLPILPLTYNSPLTGLFEKLAGLNVLLADSILSDPLKGIVSPLNPPVPGPPAEAEPVTVSVLCASIHLTTQISSDEELARLVLRKSYAAEIAQ